MAKKQIIKLFAEDCNLAEENYGWSRFSFKPENSMDTIDGIPRRHCPARRNEKIREVYDVVKSNVN
jgi:hypothetical protein